jgi:superfamily II DNA or RNA helicase
VKQADNNVAIAALASWRESHKSSLEHEVVPAMKNLVPALSPRGHLLLVAEDDAPELSAELSQRLEQAFARGAGHGLLQLGAGEVGAAIPPLFAYWRELGARYVSAVCAMPDMADSGAHATVPAPPSEDFADLAAAAPPMTGAEYLTAEVLRALWADIDAAFRMELAQSRESVQDFLKARNPAWNLVGRVHFNLAENRKDSEAPFAFMATYTNRLSAHARAQHLPLGQALRDYAGAANKDRLLSLLLPVQRAAEKCSWLKAMVAQGEIFHPLRWTPQEAFRLLSDTPLLEAAGVVLRVPATWKAGRPPRPKVSATIGGKTPSVLGADALLDFRLGVSLDGELLTQEEIAALLEGTDGLAMVRGRWVEVDQHKLERMLDQYRGIEKTAANGGLSFAEAMRMLVGADISDDEAPGIDADWSSVVTGPWLAETLNALRSPAGLARVNVGNALKATLRPYQEAGLRWLYLLHKLGLGACLADDMGLGKTIQVLALLLVLREKNANGPRASILVAPASLLANWVAEIERFAPSLKVLVAHPSAQPAAQLKELDPERLDDVDLVITSYGTLLRLPWIMDRRWRLAVLDEAQAIKNPGAKQSRALRKLTAQARIALTGTPVENRLADLWSIFDFINPGLLGSGKEFSRFAKRLQNRPHNPYAPLRELVRPYILRRLKTDKSVIADLPDKTEVKAFCHLSARQAALYQQAVAELAEQLDSAEGIGRKGLILSYLMRFKQICNHPSHWLGDGAWAEGDSGKFSRLREIAEVIAARQEKVLVFTQFRETTSPLAAFLGSVFGREGLVLHGETAVKKRQDLVRRFQNDERVPFFVLSLKAGGTGLNLTAANHVMHFDRWWNPAVENQATDRAFRIGQTRNVLVHKFVCKGTIEEKIDALIESKQRLSADLLEGGAEMMLTEMNNDDLLKLVALDIHTAALEG